MRQQSTSLGRPSRGRATIAPDVEEIARLHARFATTIHDHVLQSLSITLMQVELSRRLCQTGQQDDAVAELDTAVAQLQVAADVLQQLMRDLSATSPVVAVPA